MLITWLNNEQKKYKKSLRLVLACMLLHVNAQGSSEKWFFGMVINKFMQKSEKQAGATFEQLFKKFEASQGQLSSYRDSA